MSLKDRIHRISEAKSLFTTEDHRPISTIIGTEAIIGGLEEGALQQIEDVSRIPRWKGLINTPDTHVGFGCTIGQVAATDDKGMISPSIVGVDIGCGMSVMRTGIKAADLDKPTIRAVMNEIQKYVPVGFGQKRKQFLDTDLLYYGLAAWWQKVAEMIDGPDETDVIEPTYGPVVCASDLPGDFQWGTSEAYVAGQQTLGTLGGGNHFIELQIATVLPGMEELAAKWGIEHGELLIMLHTGSRGLGYKTAFHYEKLFKAEMDKWAITPPNPNLAYAPLESEIGQEYFRAQLAATNGAKLNRYLIRHGISQAVNAVLGKTPTTVYDLSHNVAYEMYHGKQGKLVTHRKGATLALPPGHFANPAVYRETGHPVLIPGSMGTASYILVGRPEAESTYYSVNHGAGRKMSRRQATQEITIERFAESLKVQNGIGEVMINTRNLRDFIDEAPDAYKSIDDVIASVEGAQLASAVVKCIPIAVLKGNDQEYKD